MILVREPDAGKPPVRFDEREVETARTAPPLDSTQPLCVSILACFAAGAAIGIGGTGHGQWEGPLSPTPADGVKVRTFGGGVALRAAAPRAKRHDADVPNAFVARNPFEKTVKSA